MNKRGYRDSAKWPRLTFCHVYLKYGVSDVVKLYASSTLDAAEAAFSRKLNKTPNGNDVGPDRTMDEFRPPSPGVQPPRHNVPIIPLPQVEDFC